MKLKPGEPINNEELQDSHLNVICNNEQRTPSMTSFVDVHTPSESPDASSSESSAGGDWESGEFSKTNENVVDWPKQRRVICSKRNFVANKSNFTASTSTNTNTLSTLTATTAAPSAAKLSQNHFKSKSNNIKLTNHNNNNNNSNNKDVAKKIRWLLNMRSDPDFRETFAKSVIIQPRQSSFDSIDAADIFSTAHVDCAASSSSTNNTQSDLDGETMMLATSNGKTNSNRMPHQTLIGGSNETATIENRSIDPVHSLESQSSELDAEPNEYAIGKPCCNSVLCLHSNIVNEQTDAESFSTERSEEGQLLALDDAPNIGLCCANVIKTTSSSSVENIAATSAASSSLALFDAPSSSKQLLTVSSTMVAVDLASNKRFSFRKSKSKCELKSGPAPRVHVDANNGTSTNASVSPSSALADITKRNSRYTPFTFRELRDELRTVMRQNSNKKY